MNQEYKENLLNTLLSIKDKDILEDFLTGILTPQEFETIVIRLEIVKRLLNSENQHKIAEELGLGVATVTRGSKELKMGRFKILTKEIQ